MPRGALPAVKAMVNIRMRNDSHIVSAGKCLTYGLNGSAGNVAIFRGEVKKHRAAYVGRKIKVVVYATAVIADCGVNTRSGRRHIGKQSSHAKTHRSNQARAGVKMPHGLNRTLQVRACSMYLKACKKREPLLKALCRVAKLNTRSLPPKDIGGNHDVAIGSVLIGHRPNMLIDAEYFLYDQ
jgi:hypothetical protein